MNSWSVIFKSLYSVFRLRNSILLAFIMLVTQGAYNYMGTLLPIFTVKSLGWTNTAYSNFYASASLIGGIIGMIIGGILIDKFGKLRMLNIYFLLLIMLTSAFALLKIYWVHNWFISAFMISYQIVYVFSSIGLFAIAMECCWVKVSASQFTLYMTIGNLGRLVGAKIIGPITDNFTWQYTLLAFSLCMVLALILIQFLNIEHHVKRVKDLHDIDIGGDLR